MYFVYADPPDVNAEDISAIGIVEIKSKINIVEDKYYLVIIFPSIISS